MLLWEALSVQPDDRRGDNGAEDTAKPRTQRLPFDKRCCAVTKSGRRCRGRIRQGAEFCAFHDPAVSEERRRQYASKGGKRHHRLAHLPDGYLRKLTNRRAVGDAMDRLYREIRLGVITPEMGSVLFGVLTRLLDSGLCDSATSQAPSSGRSKADRIRPKVTELLTRTERAAWRRAVANAPLEVNHSKSPGKARSSSQKPRTAPAKAADSREGVALQLAS